MDAPSGLPLSDRTIPAPIQRVDLHAQLRALDPQLPDTDPLRAAGLVTLAAYRIGPNVDRVARFTEAPREFVARCLRRLYDNGVQLPSTDAVEPDTFWADAQVALGRWCRRVGESGEPEWAPAGRWRRTGDAVEVAAESRSAPALAARERGGAGGRWRAGRFEEGGAGSRSRIDRTDVLGADATPAVVWLS